MTPAQQLGKDIFYEIYQEIGAACHNPHAITLRLAKAQLNRFYNRGYLTLDFYVEALTYIDTL